MEKPVMTLGVFANANAGKTTITEQIIYHANLTKTRGRVDHGNASTDSLAIEKERGISVKSALVTLPLVDRNVQLIDTPGHIDFSSEVERAINVLDGAILVVSGVEGVEPQTQIIWKLLKERDIPTIIFINKMDRLGADFNKVIKEMQQKLDENIIPLVNITKNKNDQLAIEDINQEELIEKIAYISDEVIEKYLNEGTIPKEYLYQKIKKLSQSRKLFVTLGGSALNDYGIQRLITGISDFLPVAKPKKSKDFTGYVYTIKREKLGRELYIKVLNGELVNRQEIINNDDLRQKVRTLAKIEGFKKVRVDKLETGEIGIITGIDAKSGDILGAELDNYNYATSIKPLFQTSIMAVNPDENHKLIKALEILYDEDSTLNLKYNVETKQNIIDLMGNLQLEIIATMLKERFGIDVIFSDTMIIHRETPINIGKGECVYSRVSKVGFQIEPLKLGSGLYYKSLVSTDYLYPKYQKQIERLVKRYSQQGLYGWQITDALITLTEGHCDSVTSEPHHFNIAAPLALMRAIKDAGMNLQEPMIEYEINTPKRYYKDILAITSNLGTYYEKINIINGSVTIPGNAPLSKTSELPAKVTKITEGNGSIIMKPNGYQVVDGYNGVENEYYGFDPRNESIFLMDLNGTPKNLDIKRKRR